MFRDSIGFLNLSANGGIHFLLPYILPMTLAWHTVNIFARLRPHRTIHDSMEPVDLDDSHSLECQAY